MSDSHQNSTDRKPKRIRRYLKRAFKYSCISTGLFVLILLLGLIPVNNDFQETPDGIEIFVTSNAVHADLILPISNTVIDWRTEFSPACCQKPYPKATHIAVGWGDEGFFIGTPTWDDLKYSTAANALLIPSKTCMHVVFTKAEYYSHSSQSVTISETQYRRMVDYVLASFQKDANGNKRQIKDAHYDSDDAFFQAIGSYHALNTCNGWVGGALKRAGVRVPLLSTLPGTPMWYLPKNK